MRGSGAGEPFLGRRFFVRLAPCRQPRRDICMIDEAACGKIRVSLAHRMIEYMLRQMRILTRRRGTLLAIVGALLAVDSTYLSMRALSPSSPVIWAALSPVSITAPEGQAFASLAESGWQIGGTPVHNMWAYARSSTYGGKAWNQPTVAFVWLGPDPTFGHFLASIRSLHELGICHTGIRETRRPGRRVDFGPSWGVQREVEMPILGLCGHSLH